MPAHNLIKSIKYVFMHRYYVQQFRMFYSQKSQFGTGDARLSMLCIAHIE